MSVHNAVPNSCHYYAAEILDHLVLVKLDGPAYTLEACGKNMGWVEKTDLTLQHTDTADLVDEGTPTAIGRLLPMAILAMAADHPKAQELYAQHPGEPLLVQLNKTHPQRPQLSFLRLQAQIDVTAA